MVLHPFFHERLGGGPKVKLRVKLTAKPLDVKQGLLQQDELGLDLHVEAAGGLEEVEQKIAEGDLRQGLAKNGLANRSDGRLEFVDPGAGGDPAGGDVEFGDPPVVVMEESEQVLRQVALVLGGQGADDAKVNGDVATIGLDEDVARVHVGMEKVVLEDLGEKYLHPAFAQQFHAHALGLEPVDLAHRGAIDALHDQNAGMTQFPVDFGDIKLPAAEEVFAQLAGVGGLPLQVEFVQDGLLIVVDHIDRAQAPPVLPIALRQLGDAAQQPQVAADDGFDAGAHDLNHHLAAVLEAGRVDLRDGGGGQGLFVKIIQDGLDGLPPGFFDDGTGLGTGKGWDPVLQLGEFVRQVRR